MTTEEEAAYCALLKAAKAVCLAAHVEARTIPEAVRTGLYELGQAHDAVLDARDRAESREK